MNLTKKTMSDLYAMMVRIRYCEESLVGPINTGEVKTPCHLYTGQEAVAAGVLAHFTDKDHVFGTHRSHGHFLAKGGTMRQIMAEIFCRETGCAKGRGGSMHLVAPEVGMLGAAPIVGGTISLALGAALAAHIRGDKRVAAAFFGDGATGEGAIYESLNFASLHKLPMIFVCENNLYATHMPIRACRNSEHIAKIAEPFCIKTWRVDGNDVLKVHAAAKEAVALCRAGKGPAFIECLTYRFRGHVGPDDAIQGVHTDIRPKAELAAWLKKDPIVRLERYMLGRKMISAAGIAAIKRKAEAEVADAISFARRSPRPAPRDLEKYVC
jgi:pyruvate dehydrogenase E1 component alpha subunit